MAPPGEGVVGVQKTPGLKDDNASPGSAMVKLLNKQHPTEFERRLGGR